MREAHICHALCVFYEGINSILGTLAGCKVVGIVGSTHKKATTQQLGAVHVCDKQTRPDWVRDVMGWTNEPPNDGEGFDIIFDANGVRKGPDMCALCTNYLTRSAYGAHCARYVISTSAYIGLGYQFRC